MGEFCTVLVILITVLWKDNSFTKAVSVEETSHVRLSCHSVSETQRLVVNYQDDSNETLAVFTNSECSVTRGDIRCFKLDNGINTLSIVEIAVSNQTRNIVTYACGDRAPVNVTFYAKPSNVSCGPATLDESGTNVTVTCTIGKIYPQPGCVFYDTTHNVLLNGTLLPVKYVPWGSPVYFKSECSMQLNMLTRVHQKIQVYVYPSIDINTGASYGSNYTVASPLIIEPVNIKIDPSCPQGTSINQGFIKIGTHATCKCLKTSSPAVLGRVHWYRNNQRVPANETDSSFSTLPLSYPKDFNQTFQCNASPFASEPTSVTFNPQFAFGPFSILGDFNQTTIDLCSVDNSTIPINLWVSKHDVNPDIIVKAEIVSRRYLRRDSTDELHFRTHTSPLSTNITSTIYLKVTSGGKYVVTATFYNTIFNDLSVGRNISIIVLEPPPRRPIFTINEGKPMKYGITNVKVTCSAPGGYPEVSEIKISCIGLNRTKSGNHLTVVMDFDEEDNGSLCVCRATHMSGCYSYNVASAIVNIKNRVEVLTFTSNECTVFRVQEGQRLALRCLAESNTKPVFTIERINKDTEPVITIDKVYMRDGKYVKDTDSKKCTDEHTKSTSSYYIKWTPKEEPTKVGDNVWQYHYTLWDADCDNVNYYYRCRATNVSSGLKLESALYLGVNCPFRAWKGGQRFSAVLAEDLAFTLDVRGYPLPTRYELLRGFHKYSLDQRAFHVEFTRLNSPFGILKLTLFNVQEEDMTLFSLIVYNGLEEKMTYNFLLFERNDRDLKAGLIGGYFLFAAIFITTVLIMVYRHKRQMLGLRQPAVSETHMDGNTQNTAAHRVQPPAGSATSRIRQQAAVERSQTTENETRSGDDQNSHVEIIVLKELQRSFVDRNNDIPEEFTNPTAAVELSQITANDTRSEFIDDDEIIHANHHLRDARNCQVENTLVKEPQRSFVHRNNDIPEEFTNPTAGMYRNREPSSQQTKEMSNHIGCEQSAVTNLSSQISKEDEEITEGLSLTNLSSQISKEDEDITEGLDQKRFFQTCVDIFEGLTHTNTSKPFSEKGKAKTEGSFCRSEKTRALNAVDNNVDRHSFITADSTGHGGLSSMNPSLISEHDEEKKENNVMVTVPSKPDLRNLDVASVKGHCILNCCTVNVPVNEPSEPILSRSDVGNAAGPSRVCQPVLPYSVTVLCPRYERDRTAIFKVLNPSESSGNSIISSVINPSETSGNSIDAIVMNTPESSGNFIILRY